MEVKIGSSEAVEVPSQTVEVIVFDSPATHVRVTPAGVEVWREDNSGKVTTLCTLPFHPDV